MFPDGTYRPLETSLFLFVSVMVILCMCASKREKSKHKKNKEREISRIYSLPSSGIREKGGGGWEVEQGRWYVMCSSL